MATGNSGNRGAKPNKKAPLGQGGRFASCVAENQDKDDPEAFCAAIGRAKYGKKGMAALASKGTGGAKTALAGARAKKKG